MSYDIYLYDPDTEEPATLEEEHHITGGTYQVGGTREAWLNVTYNYSEHYYRVFGDKGIRTIYHMTGEESIPVIEAAIEKLGTDTDDDYWKSTEGNARKALENLLALARMFPYCIWDGD